MLTSKLSLYLKLLAAVSIASLPFNVPLKAQNTQDQVAPLSPSVLAEIREAPYSEIFTLEDIDGSLAYAVKDRDYEPGNQDISIITLWGDIPEENVLQLIVRYCLNNRDLSTEEAHLAEFIVADGDQVLFKLDHEIAGTVATRRELSAPQFVPRYYSDPFYDPYWNPFYFQYSYSSASYIPPVECSFGGSRFDLTEVSEAIAQLPEKTLDIRLVFSNGIVENWRLGKKTIQQLKQLPSIQAVQSP